MEYVSDLLECEYLPCVLLVYRVLWMKINKGSAPVPSFDAGLLSGIRVERKAEYHRASQVK